MSDEDTELRDLVMQTLDVNGSLGKIRAQLRASVFLALEDQDSIQNQAPVQNNHLQHFLSTKEGRLVGGLVREFLEFFNLDSTLAVFEPESGLGPECPRRNVLSKELNLPEHLDSSKNPLLLEVIQNVKNGTQVESSKDNKQVASTDISQSIPMELSDQQINDAREKFEYYDKDCNNSIDKDELRDLFMDMFPNFHRNMLDRYVNDEFKSIDKDFNNSIDFEEFLGMYRRLFILCRSVVTMETVESQQHVIKKTKDTVISPLSSKSESISEKKDLSNSKLFQTKNPKNPDINDILGSDLDDDSFFDDPPPNDSGLKSFNGSSPNMRNKSRSRPSQIPVFSPLRSESKDKSTSKISEKKDLISLNDAPPLPKGTENDNNLRSIDKRLTELGLDADDDIDYEDDFDASGHSLSQKSPRVNSSKSDIKSYNENGSIGEEIEEDIEFSIEEGDLKSGMDDFTTDCSISQADRGFDYAEDLQLP